MFFPPPDFALVLQNTHSPVTIHREKSESTLTCRQEGKDMKPEMEGKEGEDGGLLVFYSFHLFFLDEIRGWVGRRSVFLDDPPPPTMINRYHTHGIC